jgi:hypothetical protein
LRLRIVGALVAILVAIFCIATSVQMPSETEAAESTVTEH